jgi:hypothetical protein
LQLILGRERYHQAVCLHHPVHRFLHECFTSSRQMTFGERGNSIWVPQFDLAVPHLRNEIKGG